MKEEEGTQKGQDCGMKETRGPWDQNREQQGRCQVQLLGTALQQFLTKAITHVPCEPGTPFLGVC